METVQNYRVDFLKPHPRNNEFFDDITGKAYDQFKASIQNTGITTALLVAPDMTVVSGHQRLRAAKDLGLETVPIIIRQDVVGEDDKLEVLLASNFARAKNNEQAMRKVAVEYVKLCGKRGSGRIKNSERHNFLTQPEIAGALGVSESALQKMLEVERKLTPELRELLDTDVFSKTTASKILVRLSKPEQEELLATFGKEIIAGATQKQMQAYVDRIKGLEEKEKLANEEIKASQNNLNNLIRERDRLALEYRSQYERNEQLKKQLEESNRDAKKSQAYSELKNQAAANQKKIDALVTKLKEYEGQIAGGVNYGLLVGIMDVCKKSAAALESSGASAALSLAPAEERKRLSEQCNYVFSVMKKYI